MILSDVSMRQRMRHGDHRIVIEPLDESCIQPASIDLHLADTALKVSEKHNGFIHPKWPPDMVEVPLLDDEWVLWPQTLYLASTTEYVAVPPDLVAEVWGKSSLARLGLQVHVTAGYIDPGFCGQITLELVNLSHLPIVLRPGMKICQISFRLLDRVADKPYGSKGLGSRYQHQRGPTPAKAEGVK